MDNVFSLRRDTLSESVCTSKSEYICIIYKCLSFFKCFQKIYLKNGGLFIMNKKGTRNTNGEGCIYNTVAKHKRKKFLPEECSICKNCKDRSACNNRVGYEKCQKCEDCKTECLNYCDRFYCYDRNQAQITINGKQTTVANEKKRKDAVSKKIETEAKVHTKNIIEVVKKIGTTKFEAGKIIQNTKDKDQYHYAYIESCESFQKPVQKVTYDEIQDFLNSIRHLSQRRNR